MLKETIILFENKGLCDKISFSGDKMKKQYLIYADESHRKGKFFSNFYGGALVNYTEIEKINGMIIAKKEELGLYQEVKWTKVTEQYLDKYLNLIDYFFDFVKKNKIKIRIMFRQMLKFLKTCQESIKKRNIFFYIINLSNMHLVLITATKTKVIK